MPDGDRDAAIAIHVMGNRHPGAPWLLRNGKPANADEAQDEEGRSRRTAALFHSLFEGKPDDSGEPSGLVVRVELYESGSFTARIALPVIHSEHFAATIFTDSTFSVGAADPPAAGVPDAGLIVPVIST